MPSGEGVAGHLMGRAAGKAAAAAAGGGGYPPLQRLGWCVSRSEQCPIREGTGSSSLAGGPQVQSPLHFYYLCAAVLRMVGIVLFKDPREALYEALGSLPVEATSSCWLVCCS